MTNQPAPGSPEGAYLSDAQVAALLQPLDPRRVHQVDGMSHLQGWDVRAQLNRVFGFGRWSTTLDALDLLYDVTTEGQRPRASVAYRATVTLTIYSPGGQPVASYTEAGAGGMSAAATMRHDAHDNAIKTAQTSALKRCAANLGTRFGLSLYDNGATHDVVARTLVLGEAKPQPSSAATVTLGEPRPAFPEPGDSVPTNHTTQGGTTDE